MTDYHGELKQELFVRCMEWYTNTEVETKINFGRRNGSKIKSANFCAQMRRAIDNIALLDGQLPSEYRLQFDKRRAANLEARFGSEHISLAHIRSSVNAREALSFPTLSANPSLQELEAARPENGTKPQKARETRDYWYRFEEATRKFTIEQLCTVYDMAASSMRNDIMRATRIVDRLKEVQALEDDGHTVPQTYILAPLLRPGQQISKPMPPPSSILNGDLILTWDDQTKVQTNEQPNSALKSNSIAPAKFSTSASPPTPYTPSRTTLLSARMKITLARLRAELDTYPDQLPPLATLATRFEAPIECLDATISEHRAFASCGTAATLAAYISWCAKVGDEIISEHVSRRVAFCLSHIIRVWRDTVLEAEEQREVELEETFLEAVMHQLGDLDDIESQLERMEMAYEEAALELQLAEPL